MAICKFVIKIYNIYYIISCYWLWVMQRQFINLLFLRKFFGIFISGCKSILFFIEFSSFPDFRTLLVCTVRINLYIILSKRRHRHTKEFLYVIRLWIFFSFSYWFQLRIFMSFSYFFKNMIGFHFIFFNLIHFLWLKMRKNDEIW